MSETGITSLHGETTLDHETAETDVLEDEEIRRERAFRERLRESNGENTDEQDGGREVNTAVRMEYQRLMRVGTGAPAGTRDIETRSVNSGGRPERHPIQPSREEHLDSAELGRGLIGLNSHAMASTRPIDGRGPVEFNHAINYVNKIKVSLTGLALWGSSS